MNKLFEFENRLVSLLHRIAFPQFDNADGLPSLINETRAEQTWLNATFEEFRPHYFLIRFHLPILEITPFHQERRDAIRLALSIIDVRLRDYECAYESLGSPPCDYYSFGEPDPPDPRTQAERIVSDLYVEAYEESKDITETLVNEVGRAIALLATTIKTDGSNRAIEMTGNDDTELGWSKWSDWMSKKAIVIEIKLGVWKTLLKNTDAGIGPVQVENNPDHKTKGRFRRRQQLERLATETGTTGITGTNVKRP